MLLTPSLAPPSGGIQRLADDIVLALGDDVVQVVGVSTAEREDPRVHVVVPTGPSRGARAAARARFMLAARRAAMAHPGAIAHALTWRAAAPLLLVPRRRRPRFVLHCQGAELNRCRGAARAIRSRVFAKATSVVAISAHTAALASAVGGRQATLVPPALRTLPPDPGPRPRRAEVHVLSVSRLVPHKGHDDLIRAVAVARRAGVSVRLTIVGTGPDERRLREIAAEQDLSPIFAGHVTDAELEALYRDADVFALLTREHGDEVEGFGIVFLEAGSHRLPVVAGRAGGTADAVDDGTTGFLVRGADEAATAIERLAGDADLRTTMGDAGRRWAAALTLPTLAARLRAVYDEVVADAG